MIRTLLFLIATTAGPVAAQLTDTIPLTGAVRIVHAPASAAIARQLADVARGARPLPGLPAEVLDSMPLVHVLLAPDATAWDSLTGGRAPDWGAGVAIPAANRIILPAYASTRGSLEQLPRVLRHELAHVALRRYLDSDPPRWFTEGYAVWAAGQLDTEAAWLLRLAFMLRRAPPLDSLTLDWPRGATDARVAYLLSASVLEYLYDAAGENGLRRFLERWRLSGDLEASLRVTYGLTLGQLERYWGRSVRRRYGWLLFAAQTAVIWAMLSTLVVGLWLLRRRRDRHRLERLRAEEIPDEPAFWENTGDDDAARDPPPAP